MSKGLTTFSTSALMLVSLSGCSLVSEAPCETAKEIEAQERESQRKQKELKGPRTTVNSRSALEDRYQAECVDFRHYLDDFDNVTLFDKSDKLEKLEQSQDESKNTN